MKQDEGGKIVMKTDFQQSYGLREYSMDTGGGGQGKRFEVPYMSRGD